MAIHGRIPFPKAIGTGSVGVVCCGGLWSCSQFQRQFEGVTNWRLPKEEDLKGEMVHVDHILMDLSAGTQRFQFSWGTCS